MFKDPILNLQKFDGIDLVPEAFPNWQLEAIQLDCGPTLSIANALNFPDLTIMHCYESHASLNHVRIPSGTTLFGLTDSHMPDLIWNGTKLSNNQIVILASVRDHTVLVPAGFDAIQIEVTNKLLESRKILSEELFQSVKTDPRFHLPIGVNGMRLKNWIFPFMRNYRNLHRADTDPVFASAFIERVLSDLFVAVDESIGQRMENKSGRHRSRFKIAIAARNLIEKNLSVSYRSRDLAIELGVSERVMRYAFRDAFDTSPYQYGLKRRLHEARKRLRRSTNNSTTVTKTAIDLGFTHHSRFSGFYVNLFGETPSKTLMK